MTQMPDKKKKQPLGKIVYNNLYMLREVAMLTPAYIVLMVVEGIVWGFINSAEAVYLYNLLNGLDAGKPFAELAAIIGYMALFYFFAFIFDKVYWIIVNPYLKQLLHYKMHRKLFAHAMEMDLSRYDDPAFYNDFVFAMSEADSRAVKVVEECGKIINRLVAGTTVVSLLFTIDTVAAIMIIVGALASTVLWIIGDRVYFKREEQMKPRWRKTSYINRVYHLADYAKELRTSRAGELLLEQYDEATEEIIAIRKKTGWLRFLLYGIGTNTTTIGAQFATLLRLLSLLVRGELLLGGFTAAINNVWRVRWFIYDLCDRVSNFPEHALYIEKYLSFMRAEPSITSGTTPMPEQFESLELRHVSFAYPAGKDKDGNPTEAKETLHDVSLTIRRGDKVALVGYNGAGKTTLIKLIMRLYDPTEGAILFNGIDIRTLDVDAYRAMIGTVFQDFKLFAASIGENVLCRAYTDEDEATVREALAASDFTEKLDSLEQGIKTHLTREFDKAGTNLSGGEAQKVAIARVFARPYAMVIMDEPSAALDPLAEYALNHNILARCAEQTVIFISHRLSTTRMAEQIYMLVDGRIAEAGSHESLMAMEGKYAEMFDTQAENYRRSQLQSA